MPRNTPSPPSVQEQNPDDGTPKLTVRLARPAEAERISSVLYAAFASYAPLYTEAAFYATVLSPAQIEQRMTEGPHWVAETDAGIVGTVAAVSNGHSLRIRGMAVIPSARGQRVGSALLREAERFAVASGHGMLELCTTLFLTEACRLYERHGFLRTHPDEQLHGTPLIAMQKTLSSRAPSLGRSP